MPCIPSTRDTTITYVSGSEKRDLRDENTICSSSQRSEKSFFFSNFLVLSLSENSKFWLYFDILTLHICGMPPTVLRQKKSFGVYTSQ